MASVDERNHIPAVLSTKYFKNCEMYRVLIPEVEESVAMYKMKYFVILLKITWIIRKMMRQNYRRHHNNKYQGKFTASREVMENICNIK